MTLGRAVEKIGLHAASGVRHPPRGSLLAACSARQAGVDPFDASSQVGLPRRHPLRMLLQPCSHVTSCDLLHAVGGVVIFDLFETPRRPARRLAPNLPDDVVKTFHGPHRAAPASVRAPVRGSPPTSRRSATVLRPTASTTPTASAGSSPRSPQASTPDAHQGGRGGSTPSLADSPRRRPHPPRPSRRSEPGPAASAAGRGR